MTEATNKLLEVVIEVLVTAIIPLLTVYITLWLKQQIETMKAKMSADQLAFATQLIDSLVLAAEQLHLDDAAADVGAEKKAWVVKETNKALDAKGIHLDVSTIANLIEGAVMANFNMDKLPEHTPEPVVTAKEKGK